MEKEKRIKSEEKSTQCNITKKIIDDLKDEIDLLHFEKEHQDEKTMKLLKLEMTQLEGHIMKKYGKFTMILEVEELAYNIVHL